jgi:hypothetical protein
VRLDLDEHGRPIGLDIEHASTDADSLVDYRFEGPAGGGAPDRGLVSGSRRHRNFNPKWRSHRLVGGETLGER